jgi:DNA polymerase III delta subunit
MVYLILGDDIFLQTEAIDRISATVKTTHGDSLHTERHDAESFGLSACIEAVQNVSMWGSHTFVIVRNIDEWDMARAEPLLNYTKSQNPASTLVLQADKVDGRMKIVQQLKTACKVIECKPLYAAPKRRCSGNKFHWRRPSGAWSWRALTSPSSIARFRGCRFMSG